jgi:hypothetical protein
MRALVTMVMLVVATWARLAHAQSSGKSVPHSDAGQAPATNVVAGPRPTPRLVGLSIAQARKAVGNVGTYPFEVTYQADAERLGAAALVAVQHPAPGEPMYMGDGVEVNVGVKVPDFRGKTVAAATAAASNLLLNVVPLEDVGPTAGPIETQDPPKDTVVEPRTVVHVGVRGLVADDGPNDGGPREANHGEGGPSGPPHEPPRKVTTADAAPAEPSPPTGGVVQTGPEDAGGADPRTASVPPATPPRSPPWLLILLAVTVMGLVVTGTARRLRGSGQAERAGMNPPPPSVTIEPDLGSGQFEVRESDAAVARSIRVRAAAEPSQPRVIGDDRGEVKVTVRRTDG